jgi:hypothetical protein
VQGSRGPGQKYSGLELLPAASQNAKSDAYYPVEFASDRKHRGANLLHSKRVGTAPGCVGLESALQNKQAGGKVYVGKYFASLTLEERGSRAGPLGKSQL